MEKKSLLILIFILIVAIFAVVLSFVLLNIELSPKQSILEDCNTLDYKGEGKTNIVFFSEEKEAEKYVNFFLSLSPFRDYREEFNFFYINDYEPECEFYQGIALLCHSKELVKKSGSCPNDYIVVLKEESSKIRSSSYMNVLSINTKHSLNVLPHEFAHAFVSLSDEYVPATIPKKAKNCVSNCDGFGGLEDGCYEGCGKEEYIRSINNGLMRTLSSDDYGNFNENVIIDEIIKNSDGNLSKTDITGMAVDYGIGCEDEKYYLFSFNYTGGELKILDKSIESGCFLPSQWDYGTFDIEVVKEDGSIQSLDTFSPDLFYTDADGNEGEIDGTVFDYEGEFYLRTPVISEGESLIVKGGLAEVRTSLLDIDARPCKI